MRPLLLIAATACAAFAQTDFDFKTLDKLAAKAKEANNITLDADTIKAAMSLTGKSGELSDKVKDLKAMYVGNYEYAEEGQYDAATLAPLLAYLNRPEWKKILDSKDGRETTQICVKAAANGDPGGMALVSLEPKEVTVIFISGSVKPSDIGKLSTILSHKDGATDKK
jgi:hypothetical protein